VFTRRFRAAAVAGIGSAVLILGPWAVIGFSGLMSFPELLRADAIAVGDRGVFLQGVLRHIGFGYVAALAIGLIFAIVTIVFGRRLTDEGCFAACLLASLFATPIAWVYYLWLAIVALLVARRTGPALVCAIAWSPLSYLANLHGEKTVSAAVLLVSTVALFALAIWPPSLRGAPAPA